MDLIVVLWKVFAPIDLIVVLCKIFFLDSTKSYGMSCGLNRVMCLLGAIPLADSIGFFFFVFLFVGTGDAVHTLEDDGEVGITSEITIASPPPRLIAETSSSVGANSLSSEVADFLEEFDSKTPNPHPEQYFWCFNGPLVPFGNF